MRTIYWEAPTIYYKLLSHNQMLWLQSLLTTNEKIKEAIKHSYFPPPLYIIHCRNNKLLELPHSHVFPSFTHILKACSFFSCLQNCQNKKHFNPLDGCHKYVKFREDEIWNYPRGWQKVVLLSGIHFKLVNTANNQCIK